MPRASRVLAAGFVLAVALPGLAACRTSPDVAAYVGDDEVTVAELENAVHDRLADADLAKAVSGREADYTRFVLGVLVRQEVYDAVAERYDVAVSDRAVRARIDQIVGANDPEEVYASYARQGVTRGDIFEDVRQQLLRQEVAQAAGKADALSEDALRARYTQTRDDLAELEFGVITVPDQATADDVLAELTKTPGSYATVAAEHAGAQTLAQLERRSPKELPAELASRMTAATPGTGFTAAVPGVGVVVYFVSRTVYPTFDEVRGDLETDAGTEVGKAGEELVADVRHDLDITVNPRYGVIDEEGRLVPGDGGVVSILADKNKDDGAKPSGTGG
jgi:hypothetical protein